MSPQNQRFLHEDTEPALQSRDMSNICPGRLTREAAN